MSLPVYYERYHAVALKTGEEECAHYLHVYLAAARIISSKRSIFVPPTDSANGAWSHVDSIVLASTAEAWRKRIEILGQFGVMAARIVQFHFSSNIADPIGHFECLDSHVPSLGKTKAKATPLSSSRQSFLFDHPISGGSPVLVHRWRSRREGRMLFSTLRIFAQILFELSLHTLIYVPCVYQVHHLSGLYSVAWVMPLAADVKPVPHVATSVMRHFLETIRTMTFAAQTNDELPPLYPLRDGGWLSLPHPAVVFGRVNCPQRNDVTGAPRIELLSIPMRTLEERKALLIRELLADFEKVKWMSVFEQLSSQFVADCLHRHGFRIQDIAFVHKTLVDEIHLQTAIPATLEPLATSSSGRSTPSLLRSPSCIFETTNGSSPAKQQCLRDLKSLLSYIEATVVARCLKRAVEAAMMDAVCSLDIVDIERTRQYPNRRPDRAKLIMLRSAESIIANFLSRKNFPTCFTSVIRPILESKFNVSAKRTDSSFIFAKGATGSESAFGSFCGSSSSGVEKYGFEIICGGLPRQAIVAFVVAKLCLKLINVKEDASSSDEPSEEDEQQPEVSQNDALCDTWSKAVSGPQRPRHRVAGFRLLWQPASSAGMPSTFFRPQSILLMQLAQELRPEGVARDYAETTRDFLNEVTLTTLQQTVTNVRAVEAILLKTVRWCSCVSSAPTDALALHAISYAASFCNFAAKTCTEELSVSNEFSSVHFVTNEKLLDHEALALFLIREVTNYASGGTKLGDVFPVSSNIGVALIGALPSRLCNLMCLSQISLLLHGISHLAHHNRLHGDHVFAFSDLKFLLTSPFWNLLHTELPQICTFILDTLLTEMATSFFLLLEACAQVRKGSRTTQFGAPLDVLMWFLSDVLPLLSPAFLSDPPLLHPICVALGKGINDPQAAFRDKDSQLLVAALSIGVQRILKSFHASFFDEASGIWRDPYDEKKALDFAAVSGALRTFLNEQNIASRLVSEFVSESDKITPIPFTTAVLTVQKLLVEKLSGMIGNDNNVPAKFLACGVESLMLWVVAQRQTSKQTVPPTAQQQLCRILETGGALLDAAFQRRQWRFTRECNILQNFHFYYSGPHLKAEPPWDCGLCAGGQCVEIGDELNRCFASLSIVLTACQKLQRIQRSKGLLSLLRDENRARTVYTAHAVFTVFRFRVQCTALHLQFSAAKQLAKVPGEEHEARSDIVAAYYNSCGRLYFSRIILWETFRRSILVSTGAGERSATMIKFLEHLCKTRRNDIMDEEQKMRIECLSSLAVMLMEFEALAKWKTLVVEEFSARAEVEHFALSRHCLLSTVLETGLTSCLVLENRNRQKTTREESISRCDVHFSFSASLLTIKEDEGRLVVERDVWNHLLNCDFFYFAVIELREREALAERKRGEWKDSIHLKWVLEEPTLRELGYRQECALRSALILNSGALSHMDHINRQVIDRGEESHRQIIIIQFFETKERENLELLASSQYASLLRLESACQLRLESGPLQHLVAKHSGTDQRSVFVMKLVLQGLDVSGMPDVAKTETEKSKGPNRKATPQNETRPGTKGVEDPLLKNLVSTEVGLLAKNTGKPRRTNETLNKQLLDPKIGRPLFGQTHQHYVEQSRIARRIDEVFKAEQLYCASQRWVVLEAPDKTEPTSLEERGVFLPASFRSTRLLAFQDRTDPHRRINPAEIRRPTSAASRISRPQSAKKAVEVEPNLMNVVVLSRPTSAVVPLEVSSRVDCRHTSPSKKRVSQLRTSPQRKTILPKKKI